MDIESGRDATVEVIEKSEKFLVAMAWFAHRNDFAIEHVERRKQSSSAVPKIVVGYSFDITQAHRQHRLGALQRLHLALLVYAQHQRLVGRIKVQPGDVAHLLDEKRVSGELKAPAAMRLQAEQCEIPAHGAFGNATGGGGWVACSGLCSSTSL